MDGTIVNSEWLSTKAFFDTTINYINKYNLSEVNFNYKDLYKIVLGRSIIDISKNIFSIYLSSLDYESLHNIFLEDYLKIYQEKKISSKKDFPIHGSIFLMKNFHKCNISQCIVSGSGKKEILDNLNLLELSHIIENYWGAEDYLRGKPDPSPYYTAYIHYQNILKGLKKENCLVFEDSGAGVQSAKENNFKIIGIADHSRHQKALLSRGANIVSKGLKDPAVTSFINEHFYY